MYMRKALIYVVVIALAYFGIAAILGQVDWQLSSWYNTNTTWWFPWGQYKAVYAWELEYALIIIFTSLAVIMSFLLAREIYLKEYKKNN
jgi:hypothetical protein